MAHVLLWPGEWFFYPIGNTAATCLTRDISPDEPAHVLLLGCGDPRNILYTVFSEPPSQTRKLDFTCCDMEPCVLARNILLFAMVLDGISITTIWNTFFHFYLDKDSHSALIQQCTKLISHSESSQQWNVSPYGSLLHMCTDFTLEELRRHWIVYTEMQDLPYSRLEKIRKAFVNISKPNTDGSTLTFTVAVRSAGPPHFLSQSVICEQFVQYWKNGTTFTDKKDIAASTLLNPTFVYSLGGEGCSVHFVTNPMTSFYHAPVFGNAKSTATMADMVKSAKASFNDWCSSFKDHSSYCVVRFFLGEATAFCAALTAYAETGSLDTGIPIMEWTMSTIKLNASVYVVGSAPTTFNVIDTSNLEDNCGLLNVLIPTIPLLSRSTPSSVLYTESLIFREKENPTRHFHDRLCADITVAGLLFGIYPVDYLSHFSSYCNTGEFRMQQAYKGQIGQFHRVTTWKSAISGDVLCAPNAESMPAPTFDSTQLGTLLYDMYRTMFGHELEDWRNVENLAALLGTVPYGSVVLYPRKMFVLLLKHVRKHLQITPEQWLEVMDRFMASHDSKLPSFHDLCGQLYHHSVYTMPFYRLPLERSRVFMNWTSVPPVVRVFLAIPLSALSTIESIPVEKLGTPPLQCSIKGQSSFHTFSSVSVAFGRIILTGTDSNPSILFKEDEKGLRRKSPLVVSFIASSSVLTRGTSQEHLSIQFRVKLISDTVPLMRKLGPELLIYSAELTDKDHVTIIPENPLSRPAVSSSSISSAPSVRNTNLLAEIGVLNPVVVQLDEECKLLSSFTCKVSIENDEVKRAFGAGKSPEIVQVSPCMMRLTIVGYKQNVAFPFPVAGSENKLRLARKSSWVEVVVPASGPFRPDGMKVSPFPVIRRGDHIIPWNIPRINLSRLPSLTIKAKYPNEWYNAHVSSMMSTRERDLRGKLEEHEDALTCVKYTLRIIFLSVADVQVQDRRCFALRDKVTSSSDTLLFISDIKYDLHSHTMVCDGYVLPLTTDLTPTLLPRLVSDSASMGNIAVLKHEMQAWKRLLPAFVERCRSWSHGPNCEYKTRGRIPLTEETDCDPLCSCGRGKDIEGMKKVAFWRAYAPYVTRVALSPLFAVSYMEPIVRDPSKYMCAVCHGKGKPRLKACGVCQKVRYCGSECQKKDWKAHKLQCKP